MITVGINAFGQNPSACLVRDGQLVAFCHEERLNRQKGSHGRFPARAFTWCLTSQKLTLQDVQTIAVSWDCGKYPWKMLRYLALTRARVRSHLYVHPSSIRNGHLGWKGWDYIYSHTPSTFCARLRDELRAAGHQGPVPRIEFVEHHLAHAYQAYFQSPFRHAAVLIVDGSGEEKCVSAYAAHEAAVRPVFSLPIPQSLGWYYSAFTAYLGFRADEDEGKLMGLAALGERSIERNPWIERLERVIRITHHGFEVDPVYFKFGGNEFHPRFTDELYRFITSYDPTLEPVALNESVHVADGEIYKYQLPAYVDLAYAVQNRLEAALVSLTKWLMRETGETNLCLAGGVAMNCKANSSILDNTGIEQIFIHPASSDDGSAIGAAFVVAADAGDEVRNALAHVQVGPSYSHQEIQTTLDIAGVPYTTPTDICAEAAKLLGRGKLLGWFHAGTEMGARALGGRSIVAVPGAGVKETLNNRVKFREGWRPYCPSFPLAESQRYLQGGVETPFMILARYATPALTYEAPATVHVDGTVRPQTVRADVLPKWHHLLNCARSECGSSVLLNTSFNVRGEPIVCSPRDALRTFFCTGLDALVLEDFLVVKRV